MTDQSASERCAKAVSEGKFPDELTWCRGVLFSTDPRVAAWKPWALGRIVASRKAPDPLDWARNLDAIEKAGGRLNFAQERAKNVALGKDKPRMVDGQGEESGIGGDVFE